MLLLLALLAGSAAAKADYNPADPPEPGVYFTLTTRCMPQDGGYNLTQSGTHAFGSSVYLNVYPNTGYRFIGWEDQEGNILSTSTSFSYTMPSKDVTVTARFVYDPTNPSDPSTPVFKNESQIDFAINPPDAGYFSGNYNGTYEVESVQSFRAYSNTGFRFVNWTRNGEIVGTESTLTYTVPKGDHTLVANFEFDPSSPGEPGEQHFYRKLTLESNMKDAASLYGAGEYLDGSSHRVYLYVNDYFTFVNWTDESGEVVSETADFDYTMPNRNVTLTANFTYFYDPNNPGEPGTPNPDGSVGTNMVLWPRFGMYDNTHVQILCETPGSTIHYTLDGTDPTAASPVYTEPVYVSSNLLVKAIAYKEGMEDSPIVSFQVTAYKAAIPVFTFENKAVKITSDTPDAIIRYTTDFTEPTAESTVYTAPFLPENNCRIKAYASKEGLTDSPVSFYLYREEEHILPAPTFSINTEGKLVIIPPVKGGDTHYTMDGTDPDESSAIYKEPLTLTENCIVKAYTTHINYFDSPVGEFVLSDKQVMSPTLTADYRNRRVTVSHPQNLRVEVTVDGETTEVETPYTLEVMPGMSVISAIALADDPDKMNSFPQSMDVVFHKAPELRFDGHELTATPAADDPMAEGAEGVIVIADEAVGAACVLTDFGTYPAHVESSRAFRSDDATIDIDFFNSGLVAGARNGHRLQEAFGTWGDKPEDYDYLIITGKAEKADLEFLATLPELTILQLNPAEVTTENCDSIFAGTRIETINSTGYPEGMLKGMRRLTTVMWWRTDSVMPEGRIAEAANPNILFWTLDPANAPSDARNIVEIVRTPDWSTYTGVADTIRLEAGYPFKANSSIAAKLVEVTKQFDATTEPGVCRGWETIALPFAPDRIVHENGTEIVPFDAWSGFDNAPKPFWLYTANGSDWEPASAIEAEMPYIISMPNNPDYIADYNLAGRITFMAEDVSLSYANPDDMTTPWKESMSFKGTFMPVEEDGVLSINTNGEVNGVPGSLFTAEARTLPFGAYVTGAGSRKNIPVFGDEQTGLPGLSAYGLTVDSPAPGTIRISSMHDCRVTVAAATGATVAVVDIKRGETVLVEGLVRGVYIAAGMKVIVK